VQTGSGPAAVTLISSCVRREREPFAQHPPLSRSIGMGRSRKGQGSQKTCLGSNQLCGMTERNRS